MHPINIFHIGFVFSLMLRHSIPKAKCEFTKMAASKCASVSNTENRLPQIYAYGEKIILCTSDNIRESIFKIIDLRYNGVTS